MSDRGPVTSPSGDASRSLFHALRGLVTAADPLCGKLEVIPGRVKLPPEYYPAASSPIQALREAVAIAKTALEDDRDEALRDAEGDEW